MPATKAYRDALSDFIAREAQPVEKFGHQPRLCALAWRIGEGQAYDDNVVFAAAWLHDLGVFTGHRPENQEELAAWDNVAYAMDHAPDILSEMDFPAEKIPAVVEVIRTHQPGSQPTSTEGTILRDADILEQLGAIGILRAVCKIGRDTRFPTFTSVVALLRKNLASLPEQLMLASSREMAKPKVSVLRAFLQAVDEEAENALF